MFTIVCTLLALMAFAANSVLCRLALGQESIDPASFSTIRLCAGAATLILIQGWRTGAWSRPAGSWFSASMLFLYAIPFSFAYVQLEAGSGALILFGAVQLTMIILALMRGERPHVWQWMGFGLAIGGLIYFLSPGLSAPSPTGAALMAISGCAWGVYSLLGKGHANPLGRTAGVHWQGRPPGHCHVEPRGRQATHFDCRRPSRGRSGGRKQRRSCSVVVTSTHEWAPHEVGRLRPAGRRACVPDVPDAPRLVGL